MGVAEALRPFLSESYWRDCVFNGRWHTSAGSPHEVFEPATGASLGRVGTANASDIAIAAQSAATAQKSWVALPPRERADILGKAGLVFERHFDEIALHIARETGAILAKGQHEVREAITLLRLAAAFVHQPKGVVLPSAPGRLSLGRRIPHGVVGVISPFNFPLILSLRAVAPALAAGNAVVLKPDPQTPVAGGFAIARAFDEAGLPKGVLQVLPGAADAGEALCIDPHVGMIAFTGSTAAGRRVGELAGKHLKKVSLELGGKNSLIVLEDADLDRAASNVAWGAFFHQGQICMATGRVLVHEKVAAELTKRIVARAMRLPVGDPATQEVALGPLINERQLQRVHSIVHDSIRAGARLEAGGSYERLFYKPTVLSGVQPGMRAFDEEIFGPVANIVSFRSDDEAVALANATEYGLSAAVISASVGRAMAIGERLDVGLLHINDQTVNDESVNPFGGRGCSGNGGNVGATDWDQFGQLQWVTIKDTPPQYPF